ncbi:hypothetical protein Vadar_032138 [Vaccinium darrowii]|uniref:Uncharacterized protein n=1 Tax=Vaccinium darrowii TaxID=229202 RepID=A0ACB7Y3J1_9ERIC|nr:hypothetical protein Vadar_032138 [Vaccinium darrowii]
MEKDSGVVPEGVMEAVKRTSNNMSEFQSQFVEFLSLCDPDVLAELPPLQRAKSLLLLAKATTTLFTLRLRCNGVHPDDHAVKSEIERLSLYQDKLERFIDLSKAPLRPSTTLNYQAATRFIEHSLPDLTPDQRQSMRDISKGEGPKMKYLERSVHKKRKLVLKGLCSQMLHMNMTNLRIETCHYMLMETCAISGRYGRAPDWLGLNCRKLCLALV